MAQHPATCCKLLSLLVACWSHFLFGGRGWFGWWENHMCGREKLCEFWFSIHLCSWSRIIFSFTMCMEQQSGIVPFKRADNLCKSGNKHFSYHRGGPQSNPMEGSVSGSSCKMPLRSHHVGYLHIVGLHESCQILYIVLAFSTWKYLLLTPSLGILDSGIFVSIWQSTFKRISPLTCSRVQYKLVGMQ